MELQPDRVVERAVEVLRTKHYAQLATAGVNDVHVRLVQLLDVEDDLTVWFITSPRSRKAAEIKVTGRATLAADDDGTFTSVSVIGAAELIDDPVQLQARWIDELERYYPDGPTGGDCVLVRVETERVEVIDFAGGITPPPFGLVSAVAVRADDGWELVAAERED